jgi:hypothetical protein
MIDLLQPPSWWLTKERPHGLDDDSYREAKNAISSFLERAGLVRVIHNALTRTDKGF